MKDDPRIRHDLGIRLLTAEELMKLQGFECLDDGEGRLLSDLLPETRRRIEEGRRRFLRYPDRALRRAMKERVRLRMIVKWGKHLGYEVFTQADRPGVGTCFGGSYHFHGTQYFPHPPPRFCAADRDGDCTHPGCPQLRVWQSSCPVPDYPEED